MAAPKFQLVQSVAVWASGSVTEFSNSGGAGNYLGSLSANISFGSNNAVTGYQSDNSWSAAYPVPVGNNSYEFVMGLKVTQVADNAISNLKVWAPSYSADTGIDYYVGTVASSAFSVPVSTASTKATTNFTALTDSVSNYLAVAAPSNLLGSLSAPIYFQARTTGSATGGNQSQKQISCSLDWS